MEGFDAKFDPPLDKRLECPICLLAQREPMQTPCGHRFCSACILRALRETGPRCPVDNTRVAVHQLFKDNFAKREVLSLHVCCHADEQGCSWQGELRKLELHEKTCSLISIFCPNECGYQCQRKNLYEHLPSCPNSFTPCISCSISFPKNKLEGHTQFCSKIKLPDATLGDISKNDEVLKWCGHLKMKLHGQSYSATGYLTAKKDSEERFIHSGCWSSNISLIPLTGPAARIFWRTLQGPEVKPVDLFFNVLAIDSRANAFQKMIKKKINAVVGLRLKPASRRELMIIYIHWNESQKRMLACVAELKNYLVREMQSKLQQLKRTSQYTDITLESSRPGPSHRGVPTLPGRSTGERGPSSSRRGYNSLRIVNVPPAGPSVSMDTPSHMTPASHVLPSILSWQLSPNFPAYPWRVQPATPSVPFFTIPSTPPQFLPAHSYPYTFAPMPAIAAPPFSINPAGIQPVPASIAIPSYAGVAVPQVTGLHAELAVTSASGQSRNPEVGPSNGGRIPAVIHSFPQPDPLAHPVSVVVDPRGGIAVPQGEVPPDMGGVPRELATAHIDHNWPVDSNQWTAAPRWSYESTPSSMGSALSSAHHMIPTVSAAGGGRHEGEVPTASGNRVTSSPLSVNSPSSLPFFSPLTTRGTESSDDDASDYISSPLNWPAASNRSSDNPRSNSSNTGTPSGGSGDEGSQNSPSSQQRAMGSALQTLADAAAFLSSSPQSEGSSSLDSDDIVVTSESYPHPHHEAHNIVIIDSDSFGSNDSASSPPTALRSNQLPSNHHGNVMNIPAQGYAPTVLPNYHHHHQSSGLEDLPVFVPVIHPTAVEARDTPPSQILYTPPEGGVVLPPQQPIAEIPPLIHVAQGSRNIIPVSDPWPAAAAIVEPVPGPAAYIHSRPIVPAPNMGGFWDEVMPSLDMRLHESQQPNM